MAVIGFVHIEAPVHQAVDIRLFGCELQQAGDVAVRHGESSR